MNSTLPDSAYRVPDFIANHPQNQDLVDLYRVIVQRMRAESEHVTMSTIQELLLERIATNYIILRWKERQPLGFGFEHSTAAKEANSFWLAMTREFNLSIRNAEVDTKAAVLQVVHGAISRALSGMHPDVAKGLRDNLVLAFDEVGL